MEAPTQTELPIREAAVQVEGCKYCTPHSWVEEGGSSTCARCALVESLRQWVEELQEEVSRPRCIKEGEQEIDGVLFETLQEEILGPCGTDFQRLPDKELQQQTDSTLVKEALWWEQDITSVPVVV